MGKNASCPPKKPYGEKGRRMASDLQFSIFDLRLKKSKIGNHQSKI